MNRFVKLSNGAWGIGCLAQKKTGDTVIVTARSGATKQITLGAFVRTMGGCYVYAIAEQPRPAAQTVGDLTEIMRLFDRARQHLRYPAIVLHVPGQGAMRISVAGQGARVPGSLNVTSQTRDNALGRRNWYGRVQRDGTFEPTRDAGPQIAERLRAFAANPAGVAAEHGRLTGSCCFCNRRLTDERSTAVGYGPDCADHFGLAWGARPAQFAEAA